VPRDRRLRDAEAARRVADGRRAGGQAFHNPAADRVREGFERIVNQHVNGSMSRSAAPCGSRWRSAWTAGTSSRWRRSPVGGGEVQDEIAALPGPDHAGELLNTLPS
jgi:hypothetical protein